MGDDGVSDRHHFGDFRAKKYILQLQRGRCITFATSGGMMVLVGHVIAVLQKNLTFSCSAAVSVWTVRVGCMHI